jgi:hypothetical protein
MTNFSEEDWMAQTLAIMDLLNNSWSISEKDQIVLLGLPAKTKNRHLQRYVKGETLPQNQDTVERLEHMFGIADALRTSYPHNELMAAVWLTTPHQRFKKQKPLHVMLEQGLAGLRSVRIELDCAYDWRIDDENHAG